MNINMIKICRLCLKSVKNFIQIQNTTKEMLGSISLQINLDISSEPVMCSDCGRKLQTSSDFKLGYFCDSKNEILKCADITQNIICPICTKAIPNKSCALKLDQIKYCNLVPDLNICISDDTDICTTCLESLQNTSWFIKNCLDIEEKICKFIVVKGTDSTGQVDLKEVQKYVFYSIEHDEKCKNKDNRIHGVTVKQEEQNEEDKSNLDLTISEEEVTFKLEESESSSNVEMSPRRTVPRGVKGTTVKIHSCTLCPFQTKYKYNLKVHIATHKNPSEIKTIVKPYKCTECSYAASRKDTLRFHILTHKKPSEVIMHKCDLCPYENKSKKNLSRHMLMHKDKSQVPMFKCEACAYETRYITSIKKHTATHKNIPKVPKYNCQECPFLTKFKRRLERHVIVHRSPLEAVVLKCNSCPYENQSKKNLKRHMIMHKDASQVVMFRCETCPYETRYRTSIKKHITTHRRDGPERKNVSEGAMVKCDMCVYETHHKRYLQRHLRRHKRLEVTQTS